MLFQKTEHVCSVGVRIDLNSIITLEKKILLENSIQKWWIIFFLYQKILNLLIIITDNFFIYHGKKISKIKKVYNKIVSDGQKKL